MVIILVVILISAGAYYIFYQRKAKVVSPSQNSKFYDQLKELLSKETSSQDEITLVILDADFLRNNTHRLLFSKDDLRLYDVENKKEEIIIDKLSYPQLSEDRNYISFYEGDVSTLYSFNKIVRVSFTNGILNKKESKIDGSWPVISGNYLVFASGKLILKSKDNLTGKETYGVDETEFWKSDLKNFQPQKVANFKDIGFGLNRSDVSWNDSKIYFINQSDHKYYSYNLSDGSIKEVDFGGKILERYSLPRSSQGVFSIQTESAVLSPDKTRIAYFSTTDDKLIIKDLSSGSEKTYSCNFEGQDREYLRPIGLEWLDENNLFAFFIGFGGGSNVQGISVQKVDLNKSESEIIYEDENARPDDFVGNKPVSNDDKYLAWVTRKINQCSTSECMKGPNKFDNSMFILDVNTGKKIITLFEDKGVPSVFQGQILGWL